MEDFARKLAAVEDVYVIAIFDCCSQAQAAQPYQK